MTILQVKVFMEREYVYTMTEPPYRRGGAAAPATNGVVQDPRTPSSSLASATGLPRRGRSAARRPLPPSESEPQALSIEEDDVWFY